MKSEIASLREAVEILTFARQHVNDCDSHEVLIGAIAYVEREITKVIMGAHFHNIEVQNYSPSRHQSGRDDYGSYGDGKK